MEDINIKIICEDENDNDDTDVRVLEKKENSVIIMISLMYAHIFENHERKYDKKPIIYFGSKLVKDYVRLPFQNSYDDDDDDFGGICLFPRAKYEFIF
jgi:hypothetical protein